MEKSISEITEDLYNRDYDEELTDEEEEALWDVAKQQINEFGWEKTFESWKEYLFSKCITPESVVNFANLFWCYCLGEYVIADPYSFLGYMYYRIDMNPSKYDDLDILDGLAITILPKAGFSDADLMKNPCYSPLMDEKLIAEVEKYKKNNANKSQKN